MFMYKKPHFIIDIKIKEGRFSKNIRVAQHIALLAYNDFDRVQRGNMINDSKKVDQTTRLNHNSTFDITMKYFKMLPLKIGQNQNY